MAIQLACATCGVKFSRSDSLAFNQRQHEHFCSVPCRVVATIAGYTRLPRWIVAATREGRITVEAAQLAQRRKNPVAKWPIRVSENARFSASTIATVRAGRLALDLAELTAPVQVAPSLIGAASQLT
jgi:hypothetical protein